MGETVWQITTEAAMSSSCAFFSVISAKDLQKRAPFIGAAVKTRLAQWLAESMHIRLLEERRQIEKQAEMLELLSRPLRSLSKALATMQGDTQELRAIIYEPEEALFASYQLIEPFFRANNPIHFPNANLNAIPVKHSPHLYGIEEARLVTAIVCCSVFGRKDDALNEYNANRIFARAAGVLKEMECQTSIQKLASDFGWLIGKDELSKIFDPDVDPNFYVTALSRIKAILFTPFKADARDWPEGALQLLSRHECFRTAELLINDEDKKATEPSTSALMNAANRFPFSYATLLTFLRDVSSAVVADGGNSVIRISYLGNEAESRFELTFQAAVDINVKKLRENMSAIVSSHEWRLMDTNYGDTVGAFILFVNRILGIGKQWTVNPADLSNSLIELSTPNLIFRVFWAEQEKKLSLSTQKIGKL